MCTESPGPHSLGLFVCGLSVFPFPFIDQNSAKMYQVGNVHFKNEATGATDKSLSIYWYNMLATRTRIKKKSITVFKIRNIFLGFI